MRSVGAAAVAILLLFSCASSDPSSAPATGATYSDCSAPTPPTRPVTVPGLIAPPESQLVDRRPTGKRLIRVKGYVEMTPVDVYRFYKGLERRKGYEFFLLEHEVFESEAFFTDGTNRNYVTARTICNGRSSLSIFVAPEDYSGPNKRNG